VTGDAGTELLQNCAGGAGSSGPEARSDNQGSGARAAACVAARKRPRPRTAAEVPSAARGAVKAAALTGPAAPEAEARLEGRRSARYDHITVEMLSESGFLDMPIQVLCGRAFCNHC
jgi:hypothetical protein